MEQTYSDKIVSLHLEKCNRSSCVNRSLCYHVGKNIDTNCTVFPFSFSIIKLLKFGCKVYDSICNRVEVRHLQLLERFPNYNITIPAELFRPELSDHKDQVQISVWTGLHNIEFKDYWKLYLIKSDDTLSSACRFITMNVPKLHYILALEYVAKTSVTVLVGKKLDLGDTQTISLDSCLTSWILNGRCPYKHYNYIDLTYDGTMRTCPFDMQGFDISKLTMPFETLFDIEPTPCDCKFKKLFDKPPDGIV